MDSDQNEEDEPPEFEDGTVECGVNEDGHISLRAVGEKGEALELNAEEAQFLASNLFEFALHCQYSEAQLEEQDWVRIPMQYLHIYAEQDPDFGHDENFAGADVECWIKDQTAKNAYLIAKGWIEEAGWKCVELEEQGQISRDNHEEDDVEYYDQALIDEQVFVFNVFSDEEFEIEDSE